jgi:hypothetical protein
VSTVPPPRPASAGRAFLAYNVLRLLLLVACLGVGWLAGLRGLPLIVGALLVSGGVSYLALRRQRIAMGIAVEEQVLRARVKLAERTEAEDSYVDSLADRSDRPSGATDDSPDPGSRG